MILFSEDNNLSFGILVVINQILVFPFLCNSVFCIVYTALSSYTNPRLMFSVVQMTWNEVHSNMFYSTFLHMARHLICTNMAYDLIIKKKRSKQKNQKISIMGSKCVGEMGPWVHSVFTVFSFVHSSLWVMPILCMPHLIVPFHKPLQWAMMNAMATQDTSVCSTVGSGGDQRKHRSSASLAFLRGIHWLPVNSSIKRPVTRNVFLFDDVITRFMSSWSKSCEIA